MSPNEKFKQIRLDKKLKQLEFGKLLGLKDYQIKDIESGKQKVSIKISILIENNFSINMRWLLSDKGEKYLNDSINLNNYSNKKEIQNIIKLFEYAPKKYLDILKGELEDIKNIIDNRDNEAKK